MRVLLVNKYFFTKGGSEVSFFNTAELLTRMGHDVVFFSMTHPKNEASLFDHFFVSHVDFESGRSKAHGLKTAVRIIYSRESQRQIAALLDKYQVDLVHMHNIHHQISPSILAVFRKRDLPVVMTLHDYKVVCPVYTLFNQDRVCEKCKGGRYYWCFLDRCTKGSIAKSAVNMAEMYLHDRILGSYRSIDAFIAPSRFLREKCREMGFRHEPIYHLSNFLETDGFEPQFDCSEKSFVYFGRLSQEKGLFALIEAAIKSRIPLRIVGEGPLRGSLEERVRGEGDLDIQFLGYKKGQALHDEIRKSLAVIIPSEWYENNPTSVLEAFALGKPVIGARIGGIPELVIDGKTGYSFESGNADDLFEKMQLMYEQTEKVTEMGKNARKMIETQLNSESHYEQLMKIYEFAIAQH